MEDPKYNTDQFESDTFDKDTLWNEYEAWKEAQSCIEDLLFYVRYDEELVQRDIQLSIENGGNHLWAKNKQTELIRNYIGQFRQIQEIMRKIEMGAHTNTLRLPEPEKYKKARESYQTLLNIVITRTEIGDIIPYNKK